MVVLSSYLNLSRTFTLLYTENSYLCCPVYVVCVKVEVRRRSSKTVQLNGNPSVRYADI